MEALSQQLPLRDIDCLKPASAMRSRVLGCVVVHPLVGVQDRFRMNVSIQSL